MLSQVVGPGEGWELLGRAAEDRLQGLGGHGKGFGICPKGSGHPLEDGEQAVSFLSPA